MNTKFFMLTICISLFFVACKQEKKKENSSDQRNVAAHVMPSFNAGDARDQIIKFVEAVTQKDGRHFVAPENRIVCFDNDGTLWTEQPLPNQIYFTFDRIRELAKSNKKLASEHPFNIVVNRDSVALSSLTKEDIVMMVATADQMEDVQDFNPIVNDWLKQAKHPRYNRKFDQTVYQPMLELLDYLRANEFKIFIVSGGSVEFMRAFAPRIYGVPTEQIIGTRMKLETKGTGDSLHVVRQAQLLFNDDKEGKVISIEEFIGKKPIMVVGNSDGDLAMMQYASQQQGRTLMVLLQHDDGQREYFYDDKVLTGALIKGLNIAEKKNWTLISMKNDWKSVFPDEK